MVLPRSAVQPRHLLTCKRMRCFRNQCRRERRRTIREWEKYLEDLFLVISGNRSSAARLLMSMEEKECQREHKGSRLWSNGCCHHCLDKELLCYREHSSDNLWQVLLVLLQPNLESYFLVQQILRLGIEKQNDQQKLHNDYLEIAEITSDQIMISSKLN